MTQSRLSDGVGIDRATMVGLIDALEQRSWVIRSAHPDDARALLVRLAPAALSMLARTVQQFTVDPDPLPPA
jgi:DNA-binding MarR family transcriptional regulator